MNIGPSVDAGLVSTAMLAASGGAALIGVAPGTYDASTTVSARLANLASATGATNIGFTQAGSNSVPRTVADKFGEWISVKDKGAKCDSNAIGSVGTDDTLAINNALASLTTGQTLLIPGFSLISGPLNVATSGIRVLGMGPGVSGFITNSATADIFTAASGLSDVSFENFSVWSTVTKTAGNCFTCPNAGRYYFYRVFMGDRTIATTLRLWRGIDFQGCDDSDVMGCTFCGIQNEGTRVWGTTGAFDSELRLSGGIRMTSVGTGVRCAGNFGGLYLGEISIDTVTDCFVIDITQNATQNREIFVGPLAILDGSTNTNINVAANSVAYLNLMGCWLASAQGAGAQTACNINSTNHSLVFKATGVRFFNYKSTGLSLQDCAYAEIVGCNFEGNPTAAGAGCNIGSACGPVEVIGGKSINNAFGVYLNSTTNPYRINCFDVNGNTTAIGGIPAAPATNQQILLCPGFSTLVANGYGTPTGGAQTANFPGATATLAQTSGELARLLLDLKASGIINA